MLKRLTYLTTASILILLAAAMIWCFNRLNTLTLAQQQTQRQMEQWRDQSQPDDNYRELQVAVKTLSDARKPLPGSLTMSPALRPNVLSPLTSSSGSWRDKSGP